MKMEALVLPQMQVQRLLRRLLCQFNPRGYYAVENYADVPSTANLTANEYRGTFWHPDVVAGLAGLVEQPTAIDSEASIFNTSGTGG
jgi:hypothetical protein